MSRPLPDSHEDATQRLLRVSSHTRGLPCGSHLHRAGSSFEFLYVIRDGQIKTQVPFANGTNQVSGFHFSGEILGLDAISHERHVCEAIALTDCEVSAISFRDLMERIENDSATASCLTQLLSQEISRQQEVLRIVGTLKADARLAAFLLQLCNRSTSTAGHPSTTLVLAMTREDIGEHLGITLETVSRGIGRLHKAGLIRVHNNRHVTIQNMEGLRQLAWGVRAEQNQADSCKTHCPTSLAEPQPA